MSTIGLTSVGWTMEHALKQIAIALSALALASTPVLASTFDNEAGRYLLSALPDAEREAVRMDRMQLCDQQPAGLYVRKGETITISVEAIPEGFYLSAMLGFRPMWNVPQDQQETQLDEGENRFTADQDGPLFFKLTSPEGQDAAADEVSLSVRGGRPLPLYVDGSMDAQDWREELAAHANAPFVQLVGDQAMITLPAKVHASHPIANPQATFAAINKVLDLENELAGFDGKTPLDQPTPLRQHYLVDFRVSKKDREGFYMYATDQFIGMLPDNTQELTNPRTLRKEWAIWHETGHTHQQHSWTWEALGEINVNLFSLYVQQSFGQPNRLATSEDGQPTSLENARDYLANGANDFLAEVDDEDGNEFFTRLVMFHQLQSVYGWDLFKDLHKHFRAHPLPEDASDQDKADAFVLALCELTGVDLRAFFETWGLQASAGANKKIERIGYPLPEEDFSQIFE